MNLGKKLGMTSKKITLVQHEKKRPPTNTKAARKVVTNINRALYFAEILKESRPEMKEVVGNLIKAQHTAEKVYRQCQNAKPELKI